MKIKQLQKKNWADPDHVNVRGLTTESLSNVRPCEVSERERGGGREG